MTFGLNEPLFRSNMIVRTNWMKTINIAIAAALTLLSGCAAPQTQIQPLRSQFEPTEYAPYSKQGTGKIVGQAFMKTVGGDVKFAAGNQVNLNPVTTLNSEWIQRAIVQGQSVGFYHPQDMRTKSFERTTVADGNGSFEFDGLPSGEYYLTSSVSWGVPDGGIIWPQGGTVYAKVRVRSGETSKVIVTR
jgi:hypothetical protein